MKDADYVHTDLRNNMTGEHATCSPKSQIPCDAAMKGKLSGGLVGDCDDDPQKGANERAIGRSRRNCAPAERARRVGESVAVVRLDGRLSESRAWQAVQLIRSGASCLDAVDESPSFNMIRYELGLSSSIVR